MLVVGTSGLVHPAAQLPYIARDAGATVIEINPEPTELTPVSHVVLQGRAAEVLPTLVASLQRETCNVQQGEGGKGKGEG